MDQQLVIEILSSKNLLVRLGKEIQLCVEEMSMEDCWLNGRFVPWQSMVNHSRL